MNYDPQKFGELVAGVEFLKQAVTKNAEMSQKQHQELAESITEIKVSIAPIASTLARHDKEIAETSEELKKHGWRNVAAVFLAGLGLSGNPWVKDMISKM